ncbi:hypothetical protein SDC9_196981 [bioreactor metagenome]|uniref:Uncharacterized protein n=1 Tax=bioreactor metagenome TaxID=1076179 RepID=A0A645IDF0_9ZZZZ
MDFVTAGQARDLEILRIGQLRHDVVGRLGTTGIVGQGQSGLDDVRIGVGRTLGSEQNDAAGPLGACHGEIG